MYYKYLNLKKTRELAASGNNAEKKIPGRRKFMQAMGLGALAWTPVVRLLNSSTEPFILKSSANRLSVYRNGKIAWEISEKYFQPGYSLKVAQGDHSWSVAAEGLCLKYTEFRFSAQIAIFEKDGIWKIQTRIPDFDYFLETDFYDWLDKITGPSANARVYSELVRLNENDLLTLNGNCRMAVSPDWQFTLEGNEIAKLEKDSFTYTNSRIRICPAQKPDEPYLFPSIKEATFVILPAFEGWDQFIADMETGQHRLESNSIQKPDVTITCSTISEKQVKIISAGHKEGCRVTTPALPDQPVELNHVFYFAEYLNDEPSNSYLNGILPAAGIWASNMLGSFRFEKNEALPDFEAFGYGRNFDEIIFEPRLRAFYPNIRGTVAISQEYQDPQRVRITTQQKSTTVNPVQKPTTTTTTTNTNNNQQRTNNNSPNTNNNQQQRTTTPQSPLKNSTIQRTQPSNNQQNSERQPSNQNNTQNNNQRQPSNQTTPSTRQPERQTQQKPPVRVVPQRPVRDVSRKQPEITIEYDDIKFRPKQAIKFRILRPEDLILLEFELHNFSFTNQGQSLYLELDDAKNAGIIVINFQSQHTLEEAYYETTSIPDPEGGTTQQVRLPAKHLRARKSRLVYELPAGHVGFPLIIEELLDWSKFKLRVHPRAWIKIPSLVKIKTPTRLSLDRKTQIPDNKNLRFLDTNSKEYGLRLAQNNRSKASNLAVYNEDEISRVLAPQASTSIKSGFDVSTIKRIDLSVGPVPDLSTSIEAPTLMYISPNQVNDFTHKIQIEFRDVAEARVTSQVINTQLRVLDPLAAGKGEVAELWHTRLGVKLDNGKTSGVVLPQLKTIRALWADDAEKDYKIAKERNYPFLASLDANNRQKLVHTTSNYGIGFTPFPVPVNDLMLTTLGAYLDWHAFFDVPNPQDTYLNIIEWEHIATLGRDHYVKIVEEGYLFPFGHRAAVVKITERKFDNQTKAAVNRQRMFVVVLEKEVLYSAYDPKGDFIEFPFQAVRIETNQTPNIDNPETDETRLISVSSSAGTGRKVVRLPGSTGNTMFNFYINVGGKGFLFDLVATDKEGVEHPFRMPLAFMENRIARDKNLMEKVIAVYQGKESNGYNKVYNEAGFCSQEIAYAESLVDGDTSFETEKIKFDAQIYPVDGEGELKFHPKMKEASVFVKQIDELTGSRQATVIGLEDDKNDGEVFARIISSAVVDFSGGSDKAGGFLMPNMAVTGLSKLQGPVSGELDKLKKLLFIPEEFFKAFEDLPVAKIFGVIEIFSLLLGSSDSPFDLGGMFDDMKNTLKSIKEEIDDLKNEILYLENLAAEAKEEVESQIAELRQAIADKVKELLDALNNSIPRMPNLKTYFTEEAFYAEYKWQPELGGKKIEVIPSLLNVNVDNPSTALSITTKFEKPFSSDKQASLNGVARFEKFGVDIVPLLVVNFNYLEFRSGSSQKTDVKVDINADNPIQFKGVLNFVNNLQSIIPSTGFSDDGPYINLKPTGVTAGFDISIPNVEVGVCMISNISLGACITLPFTGAPLTLGFNFCKRENPFMLTISCFGGGGFFMMVSTLHGIQSIEAAFEFGAAMSLNVGVASGGVSAMGGFYFKMEIVGEEEIVTLTGYLRLNGHLSILGLITLSLEFYLALTAVIYAGKVQKMEGEATLKVKVEVLFFSKTVSVSVRRELKGADADPKFADMIAPDDWQEYCLAFAS